MPLPAREAAPELFRALRHSNYRYYFLANLVSQTGRWAQFAALQWVVYELTGSAAILGVTTFAQSVPALLFSIPAGALADRLDRRKTVLATQLGLTLQASLLAGLTLSGQLSVGWILVAAVLNGVLNSLDVPLRQALLMDLVGRDDIPNAVALNAAVFNTARIFGPALAGFLIASMGAGWSFAFNASTFIGVLAVLGLLIHIPPRTDHLGARASLLADSTAGVRYVREDTRVAWIIGIAGFTAMFIFPFMTMMPVMATDVLAVGPERFGLLFSAVGAGAVLASLANAASRRHGRSLGRLSIYSASAAVTMALFAMSRSFELSLVILFFLGASHISLINSGQAAIQTYSQDAYRGRALGIWVLVLQGVSPLGALAVGAFADQAGAPLALSVSAACGFLISIWHTLRRPASISASPPVPARPEPEGAGSSMRPPAGS